MQNIYALLTIFLTASFGINYVYSKIGCDGIQLNMDILFSQTFVEKISLFNNCSDVPLIINNLLVIMCCIALYYLLGTYYYYLNKDKDNTTRNFIDNDRNYLQTNNIHTIVNATYITNTKFYIYNIMDFIQIDDNNIMQITKTSPNILKGTINIGNDYTNFSISKNGVVQIIGCKDIPDADFTFDNIIYILTRQFRTNNDSIIYFTESNDIWNTNKRINIIGNFKIGYKIYLQKLAELLEINGDIKFIYDENYNRIKFSYGNCKEIILFHTGSVRILAIDYADIINFHKIISDICTKYKPIIQIMELDEYAVKKAIEQFIEDY